MTSLCIDSNNESANYPKFYRKSQDKLKKEQRKLSKCQKKSNNYFKQKLKLAKAHEKVANQRKDFLHKTSTAIAKLYDVIYVENLNMKALSKVLNFGKSVMDNGFGMFINFLTYKAKKLIKVDKWFPSSKTCSACGVKNPNLTLKDITFICTCGNIIDRDYNAAINIKLAGLAML